MLNGAVVSVVELAIIVGFVFGGWWKTIPIATIGGGFYIWALSWDTSAGLGPEDVLLRTGIVAASVAVGVVAFQVVLRVGRRVFSEWQAFQREWRSRGD